MPRFTSSWRGPKPRPAQINAPTPDASDLQAKAAGASERFVAWLRSCTETERATLSSAVARSTAALDFAVAWREHPAITRDPELGLAVDEVLTLSSLAAWRTAEVRRMVETHQALEAWERSPTGLRQRNLTSRLYAALVQRGLINVRPELYLASDRERRAEAVEAVADLATARRPAVLAALDELLHGKPTAPAPAPDAPATPFTEAPAAPEALAAE